MGRHHHESTHLRDNPWLVLGDFNAIKDPSDRVGGSEDWLPCFNEFGQCLEQPELEDLRFVGFRYTWTTSSGHSRKARKIDRVLVNAKWSLDLSYSEASFLAPGISDHSPMVVKILNPSHRRKPFKFFDFWMKHPEFNEIVSQVWNAPGNGVPMYKLVSKLKDLKCRLKQLNKDYFSNISARTLDARKMMEATQAELQLNPFSADLAEVEKSQRCTFAELRASEESFFRQKSRIRWLREGDRNTKFFHQYVNKRHLRNRVLSVLDSSGNILTESRLVQRRFVEFFEDLLKPQGEIIRPSSEDLREVIQHPLSFDQAALLAQPVTKMEIRNTIFSMPKGKAPGPDGFTAEFFKENWDTVGPLVTTAVLDFFNSGKLLREVNNTILVMVPKVLNATSVEDYRPIACCNTIYKCITKLLANRVALALKNTIGPFQTAFIKGRRIRDNILLAQELFSSFHLQPYLPKCAIKVDFRKAYDTVDWGFLEKVMLAFGFPHSVASLIMTCVRTPKFSIALNGELHGFFASGRGLRQGDPISPYLFTMVMEVLSGIILKQSSRPDFKFFWRCKAEGLSHLFFADDVFLFL